MTFLEMYGASMYGIPSMYTFLGMYDIPRHV